MILMNAPQRKNKHISPLVDISGNIISKGRDMLFFTLK